MLKIDFEFNSKYGVYRDALYLPENHSLSENEIESLKQERFNNWLHAIENPLEVPAPETTEPEQTITVADETYLLLDGAPPSGAKLIEVNGRWYYKG